MPSHCLVLDGSLKQVQDRQFANVRDLPLSGTAIYGLKTKQAETASLAAFLLRFNCLKGEESC